MSYVVNSKGLLLYYKSYYSLRGASVNELGTYQYQVENFVSKDDLDASMRPTVGVLLVVYTNRGTRA